MHVQRRGAAGLLLSALLALLLSACPLYPSGGEGGLVSLRISDGTSSGRTMSPETPPPPASYELWGAFAGEAQELLGDYPSLAGATIALAPGSWDFTLRAYNDTHALVLEGSLLGFPVSLVSTFLNFTLEPLGGGTGRIELDLVWPPDVSVVLATASLDGDPVPGISLGASSLHYSNPAAPSGDRILLIRLFDAGARLLASVQELVRVRDNLLCQASFALFPEDCNGPPAAPPHLAPVYIPSTEEFATALVQIFDNSDNETGFELQRLDGSPVIILTGAFSDYLDSSIPRGQMLGYQIRAFNDFGASAWFSFLGFQVPYLVSFVYQDGLTSTRLEETMPDLTISTPGTPVRPGYNFTGWYTEAAGGSAWDFGWPVGSNMTLYAQWTPL